MQRFVKREEREDAPEKRSEKGEEWKHLRDQHRRIESKMRRFERKRIDDQVRESLEKMHDIQDAVSELQHALNIVWKRTEQVAEELRSVLRMPPEKGRP